MRTSFSKLSLLALPLAALTACQDYEPFSEAEVAKSVYDRNYNQNFIESIAEIAPNHNWGFYNMPIIGGAITRAERTNYNEWEGTYHLDVPGGTYPNDLAPWGWVGGDITQYERAYVYWWFSTHHEPTSISVNWSDYFIQTVWGQPEHSKLYADGSYWAYTQYGMDLALTDETNAERNDWTHINNFNAAGGSKEQVQRMENSATVNFGYNDSYSSHHYQNWTLQCINGNYYLAFDYQTHKCGDPTNCDESNHECTKRDGYYNDWILKLSPGLQKVDEYTRRVMCEDLGNTFDWDFNDIVFDVTFLNANPSTGVATAKITLQAAGGTIPVRVGINDDAHEAHGLFGVPTNTPVNVGEGATRAAVIFQYNFQSTRKNSSNIYEFNAIDVPVYVPSRAVADASLIGETGEEFFNLSADAGKAPQKFACPNSTKWTGERKKITLAYSNFEKWVKGEITDDSWTTVFDDEYLYKDAAHSSQAASSIPNVNWPLSTIEPWKQIWLNRTDSKYWAPSSSEAANATVVFTTTEGRKNGYSFSSQAPYIYYDANDNPDVYVSTDNDLKVFSPRLMSQILQSSTYNEYDGQNVIKDWYDPSKTESVIAYFSVRLSTASGFGILTGDGTYPKGSNVTIKAEPNEGFAFDHWSDNETNAERTINSIAQNIELSAYFSVDGNYWNDPVRIEGNNFSAYNTDTQTTYLVKVIGGAQYGEQISVNNIGQYVNNGETKYWYLYNVNSITVQGGDNSTFYVYTKK